MLGNLKVDKEYLLSFDDEYKHYEIVRRDYSKLFLIYKEKKGILYVLEASI